MRDLVGPSIKALTGCRDELYEPSEAKKTYAKDDETANESNRDGDLRSVPAAGVGFFDVFNEVCNGERHNSNRTDRNIL